MIGERTKYLLADVHPELFRMDTMPEIPWGQVTRLMVNAGLSQATVWTPWPQREWAQRSYEDWMGFLNGEDTRELANKYSFVEKIRELGYNQSLSQVLLDTRRMSVADMHRTLTSSFPDDDQRVFIKGFGFGIGREVSDDKTVAKLKTILPALQREGRSVVVQNIVPVARMFRAVFMDEPQSLTNPNRSTVFEHYFEGHLPVVVGDGRQTVRQLIKASAIPADSRKHLFKNEAVPLDGIPARGEALILGHVAHTRHGGWYSTPDQPDTGNVREFARRLRKSLEEHYGHRIPIFCIDIGVIDPQVLQGELSPEQAKRDIVAFELQMPFDPGFDNPENPNPYLPRFFAALASMRYREE